MLSRTMEIATVFSSCFLTVASSSCRPGQEEGNIPFVENAGFGKYSGDPSEIAVTVSSWLSSPGQLESMQKAALAAARPQATLNIARDIGEMLFKHKQQELRQPQGQPAYVRESPIMQ